MAFDYFRAVANLRTDWPNLSDVDRALRISPIIQAGTSCRTLAKALGRKEQSLRHIRPLVNASEAEKAAIRSGNVSTKAVLRAVKARQSSESNSAAVLPSLDIEKQAIDWASRIISWVTDKVGSTVGKQLLHEVRRRVSQELGDKPVPNVTAVIRIPLDEIIERCSLQPQSEFFAERYCVWLMLWVSYAILHPQVRNKALSLAEERLTVPTRRRDTKPAA
jgi:hypothetical protein